MRFSRNPTCDSFNILIFLKKSWKWGGENAFKKVIINHLQSIPSLMEENHTGTPLLPPHPHRNEGGSDKGRMEGREVDERSFKEEKTLNEKKCAAAAG